MNLTERLLGPQFEAALEEHRFVKDPLLRAYAKAVRELHARAEQYRKNWLSLQKATGEECHLRALEVIREIPELHRRLRTAKSEGAAEAYDDIRAQAEDLRKEGGIRASLLRLLAEECVSSAAAIRKGIEAKEGK